MNKAFEMILKRLEEVESRLLNESGDIGCTLGITNMSEYSKEIVKEVAEEYKDKPNIIDGLKIFLQEQFNYCAEQAEMNLEAECNSEIASYFRDRKELYLDRANIYGKVMRKIDRLAREYNGGWIPIKTRPMTEEEREYYSEYLFEGNGLIYECPLPNDGQEVLITSKFGSVEKTTFYTDCGNYFEEYEDYDDVIAWCPLPNPYKENENL